MKRFAGFVLGIAFAATALAQAFPTKPIRLVVPFGPGGVADITARTVAPEVSKGLGQQLVIENKPSAGGVVAGRRDAVLPRHPGGAGQRPGLAEPGSCPV